jgi:hypothetical protein
VFLASVFVGSSAFAQATRTWVSGVGNDADPCSRTAPCKTFAGAISKTAAGGEINVLDPGGFGAVTITKPITISAVGTQAGIVVAGTDAIIINITVAPSAPATATVRLRNLQIAGLNDAPTTPGVNGVRVLSSVATTVILDDVNIFGFGTNGVLAEGANKVSINGGTFSSNSGIAVHATGTSTINVENAEIIGNNVAVQADLGSTIRLSNNAVYDNKTGFACGTGGTLASAANNRKGGNVGGVVPTCNPSVALTIQ